MNTPVEISLGELVERTLQEWRKGKVASVKQFLTQNPEVRTHRGLMLDLIYEEYCQTRERGQTPVLSDLCSQYSDLHASIERMIAIHSLTLIIHHAYGVLAGWDEERVNGVRGGNVLQTVEMAPLPPRAILGGSAVSSCDGTQPVSGATGERSARTASLTWR